MIRWAAGALLALLVLSPPVQAQDRDDRSPLSLEALLSTGIVYEFKDHANTYVGAGAVLRAQRAHWSMEARYRVDNYTMSYFGLPKALEDAAISGIPYTGSVPAQRDADEQRVDASLILGRQVLGDRLVLRAGAERTQLLNDFSAMKWNALAIQVASLLPLTGDHSLGLDLRISLVQHLSVENKDPDFLLADGERTLSFYGEPRATAAWDLLLSLGSPGGGGIRAGYEGGLILFEHTARYYHGFTLRAEF